MYENGEGIALFPCVLFACSALRSDPPHNMLSKWKQPRNKQHSMSRSHRVQLLEHNHPAATHNSMNKWKLMDILLGLTPDRRLHVESSNHLSLIELLSLFFICKLFHFFLSKKKKVIMICIKSFSFS